MDFHYTSNLAVDLGRVDYLDAIRIQEALVRIVRAGNVPGTVLFLEHEPVYTIGRKADPANYPGIQVVKTERGGDVTYHGPGQLVVYPILKIGSAEKVDVRNFVGKIEKIFITALEKFGYDAFIGDEPGIWVKSPEGSKKVASIGMAIDHGISYHGAAVNISGEALEGFRMIRPCGLAPEVMGYVNVLRNDLIRVLSDGFREFFGEFRSIPADELYGFVEKLDEQGEEEPGDLNTRLGSKEEHNFL